MFLHLSVSHCVHSGGVCFSACWETHPSWQTPLGRHPLGRHPWKDTPGQTPPSRWPLQRTVRILLECFLVLVLCMGAYLSVLPMHFHSVFHFVLADMYYFHFYRPQTKLREVNVFTSVCLFTAGLYHTPKEPVPPKDHAPQILFVTRSKRTFPSKTHYPHNKWVKEANIKSEEFHFKDLLD